jgi:tRNA pseudouridine55 synthase
MNGVVPIDKPEGPTSHDMVAAVRRSLGIRRIGHTGTLDPFASGLLLLCVGPATRLAEYLTGLDKRYEATARLGVRTDTLDRTGAVVAEEAGWAELTEGAVRAAFEGQKGRRAQRPPAFSAKKVGGRRAYRAARAGEALDLAVVEVEIRELVVVGIDGPDVRFRIHCSSGTYVRAVAADAGEALGVGAHLTGLRRTAIGGLTVEEAVPPDRIDDAGALAAALIQPLAALRHLPVLELAPTEAAHVRHGRAIGAEGRGGAGLVALAVDGELLAVAESDGDRIRPRKVLA